ncbi:MAG: LysM peptidoglycan-binding domain-containing protein [Tannerellaceae bacterium]|jgi:membrane-bound lytic murein transglycosylase D|nr:LysM peptidoglycan-binding domain-containing protein [Tannerellaceae bacterium]
MKRDYMTILLCSVCFLLPAGVRGEETTKKAPPSVVSKDSLWDDIGLMPESLDANVDSLLHTWHVQYFSKTEAFCHDEEENVGFPDEVIRERLDRLPHVIPMTFNTLVRNSIELYTARRRNLIRYMLGMADFYFPLIEQILEEYKLPLELKYLVVVESALNPVAVSRVGACGLWQFMLPTGKNYGLEINSLVDDRRDPVKSTHAACRYFLDMYAIYGDWHLVIASYNCGPGNVNKAIRRSGGKTDFWQIYPHLPRETRSYVPLFIAAGYVMNYYCEHNICPLQTNLPLATDTVMVTQMLHLQQVADMLQMDIELLRILNPQYRRDIVPGNNKPSVLKLPAVATYSFVDKEDSLYAYRKDNTLANHLAAGKKESGSSTREQIAHVVKSGETIITIADKYSLTARDVRRWNGLNSNRVAAGKRLVLYIDNGGIAFAQNKKPAQAAPATAAAPTTASKPKTQQTTPASAPATAADSGKRYVTYRVKSGDSLYSISRKYPGVSADALQKANNLSDSKIKPGQLLKIPVG